MPGWQRFAWLRHGFSTRAGGVSSIYSANENDAERSGSLNLGWTQQDEAANVAENRRRFLAEVIERSANAVATAGSEPMVPVAGCCLPVL